MDSFLVRQYRNRRTIMGNKKEYVIEHNSAWKDEYYTLLSAVDRLLHILYSRYRSLSKASKDFGKCESYFDKTLAAYSTPPRTKTLYNICKHLNVSMNYVVFGGSEETFKDCIELTYNNFIRLYNTAYKGHKHSSINALLCMWDRLPYKSIPLKYLIKVAREQKVTIDWLIGG